MSYNIFSHRFNDGTMLTSLVEKFDENVDSNSIDSRKNMTDTLRPFFYETNWNKQKRKVYISFKIN